MKKILLIEDDDHIVELLTYNLELAGYKVYRADNGNEGYEMTMSKKPDLILLDLMMEGLSGIEVCENLKKNQSTKRIPVIILTAKSREADKILGLETGADDYITKPFSTKELLTRIKVIFRRFEDTTIKIGDVTIDLDNHIVKKNDSVLKLTHKELMLIEYLALNKGKVLSRNDLLDRVWGEEYFGDTRTLDVHIRQIRKKLDDRESTIIETIRGLGYKMA